MTVAIFLTSWWYLNYFALGEYFQYNPNAFRGIIYD